MKFQDVDELLFQRALAIASDPDSTVAQLEWARKFLNDHNSRNKESAYTELDAALDVKTAYGDIQFDLPLKVSEVDLDE